MTLRSRSWVIDFNRFSGKAQVRRATLSCDSSYLARDNEGNQQSAYAKTKAQISFAVTVKLISAFVFSTLIVQFLYFLNTKFPVSSCLLLVQPGLCPTCLETKLLVFPRGGSNIKTPILLFDDWVLT